ncbi:MAG: SAM-dependent methyltransferase [Tissierellia bacterium]|nr:SAM-dependent methyltransferase [Tissierellia bacterium]
MHKIINSCNHCGNQTVKLEKPIEIKCTICDIEYKTDKACVENHYICNSCNEKLLKESIVKYCLNSTEVNPLILASELMKLPNIPMHGPIHHLIFPATLLTAHANRYGRDSLEQWLIEADKRSSHIPGATCGHWGACGAGLGVGIFFSIINEVGPISGDSWKNTGLLTSEIIRDIAIEGGPRCCKRDGYIALTSAIKYIYGKEDIPEIVCDFYGNNRTCKRKDCPYFPI